MELVKEHPNQFESESLNQSVHLQQLLGLAVQTQPPLPPPPSTTSSITPNLNDLTKMLSIINNATSPTSPSLLISPKSSSTPSSRQCATDAQSKNCLNTSNDDSLDSQSTSCNGGGSDEASSKTRYRRRKPQKTIRMSNELNAVDSVSEPLENDDRTKAMKHEYSKHDTNHSNGLNFPSFHSDANSILTPSNSAAVRPLQPQTQTQSMDLSNHCAQNPELFENGLVNYSKTNSSLDLTHASAMDNGHCNATKDLTASTAAAAITTTNTANLMPPDELNSLNLFGSVNFSQTLRGTHLTNDIATFPNTDDLVKKVEELVKCNEQNGFGNNDFGPMELIKSHANKLVSDAYDSARLSNGMLDSIKIPSDIEHLNNHGTGAAKHNGNGLSTEIIQSNPIVSMENTLHENNRDRSVDTQSSSSAKMLPNGSPMDSNPNRNGGIKPMSLDEKRPNIISHGIDNVMSSEFTGIGPVADMIYEKMSEEISSNQSNLDKNFATNTPQQNNSASYNGSNNDLVKEALSASSSDAAPPNPPQSSSSSTSRSSASASAAKKKTNNPTNKKNNNKNASNRSSSSKTGNKSNAGKSSNQKNAKSKDNKSDKKSDINEKKKTKSTIDESAMSTSAAVSSSSTTVETLNKFRGPYVHVSRDGTLEVINAPLNEEISEKQNKFKKSLISQRPADRNRVRGLHVSTLSHKYDATTTDVSWMCVFCKLGPHKYGLGDLFGPFLLSTEGEDFQLAQIDPKDDTFGRHHRLSSSAAKSMPKSANTGNVS